MGMPEIRTTNTFIETPLDDSTWSDSEERGSYSVDSLPPYYNRGAANTDNDTIMSELDTPNTGGESEDIDSFAYLDTSMDDDPYIDSDYSTKTKLESQDDSNAINLTIKPHNGVKNPIDLTIEIYCQPHYLDGKVSSNTGNEYHLHIRKGSGIPKTWVLLDSCFTVNISSNHDLLIY